jgi:predicted TIM-barrel fold metal-dependent hydrolase
MNIHLTTDETFKDYKINMPCNINTYQKSINPSFDLIGGLIVGLPNIGNYSHEALHSKANKINYPSLAAITNSCLNNLSEALKRIKNIGFIGVKFHPRLLNIADINKTLKNLALGCKKNNLILAICTYQQKDAINKKFLLTIKEISDLDIKIILMHTGGFFFLEYYNFFLSIKNIILDTSFTLKKYEDTNILSDIVSAIKEDNKNIVFGTDFPDYNMRDYENLIIEIGHIIKTPNLMKNFLYKNALNFLELDKKKNYFAKQE